MMDNEQPWQPLGPQKVHQVPIIAPQVPEVTLFSPTHPANSNKNKFLQRAIANERIAQIPKNNFLKNDQNFKTGSVLNVKPSVPDLSLFEHSTATNRPLFNRALQEKAVQDQVFSKTNKPSPQFEAFGKHSVPDVTIISEEPKPVQQEENNPSSSVFNASFKNMLKNSHDQFMKKIKANEPECEEKKKPKQSVFTQFQVNPLRKYAPKLHAAQTLREDLDTSSILEEFGDHISNDGLEEKSDETTFKKVAEMLSEMQKLVIPGMSSTARPKSQEQEKPAPSKQNILHHLAKSFLTPDEQELFEVWDEIDNLEEES